MKKRVNKVVISAVCVSWLCGMAVGTILKDTNYQTVSAAPYQKIGEYISLVDQNGQTWQFEGIPFRWQGDYQITYYDGYILKTLELDGETIIDL